MSSAKTIVLRGGQGRYEEGTLDTAVSPGMACEQAADGDWDNVVSTKAEYIKKTLVIATEDGYQGKAIATAYVVGDKVRLYYPQRGDRLLVLVKSGENIAVGDVGNPEGGGSGLFVEAAGADARYMIRFTESSGGALGANTLLECEVL